jgi:hypothetical protein
MAALTAPRNTRRFGPDQSVPVLLSLLIADNVKIYPGALVVLNSSGYAEPATAAASKIAVGRCASNTILDNTVAGHAAGALNVPIDCGAFLWDNKAGDLLTQAQAGGPAWIEDDHTVRLTSTSSSCAGRFLGFEGTQCIVATFPGMALT